MSTKECITCHKVLSVDDFYKRSNGNPRGDCKACWCARAAEHYYANKERHKFLSKKRHDDHGRFARYGLTKDEYYAMLERQGGVCALCRSATSRGKSEVWCIDHEPRPGERTGNYPKRAKFGEGIKVRGLLCSPCNIALGHYESLRFNPGFERVERYLQG